MAAKRRVFDSVFHASINVSQPTPEIGFTNPGQPFGGPVHVTHDRIYAPESASRSFRSSMTFPTDARDQVRWDRSWHITTSFLVQPFAAGTVILDGDASLPTPATAFQGALMDVLNPETRLPRALATENLISWYIQQVRYHFLHELVPLLSQASEKSKPDSVLSSCVTILERAHRLYLYGLSFIVKQLDESNSDGSKSTIQRFRGDLHALVANSVSLRVSNSMKETLATKVYAILDIPIGEDIQLLPDAVRSIPLVPEAEQVRGELLALVESLRNVGLGGERMKILFAEVMSEAMSNYIQRTYSSVWSMVPSKGEACIKDSGRSFGLPSTSECVNELCRWIEDDYSTLVLEVLGKLETSGIDQSNVEKWKKMGVGRLAGLRTKELFDIVGNWPHSGGALDDLRTAIDTPQRRLQLTDVFSASLKERLLHPGASTLQILRTYISMIWSFHSLDHSKVLLDRVAYPLQLYLCSREDTVKIIITGLLSDTEDAEGAPIEPGGEKLVELAMLLNRGSKEMEQRADEDLDWDDMDWVPDPVDAGPGYKRSKNADVIGTLIGVLGSQEVFIKEFQNIVGENLLKSEGDFEKEAKLLDLLKTRFGEAPLQACEVMVKDILDSRRVDAVIRRNQKLDPSEQEIATARANSETLKEDHTNPEGLLKPSLHAKILSRLFWPQLQSETYRIPDDMVRLQELYERGFEALKNSRKLTWLHGLGQATVELELSDRVVLEEVHTWQATVIWAFQGDDSGESSITRTVEELVDHLEMDETLVRSALLFWVNKMVLREIRKDQYTVLETLNQEDRAKSNAQTAATAITTDSIADDAALLSNNNLTSEKMQMYWQFIQGMLTNSSPQMPLQQIAMMLKMLIVEGFPYNNEELQEFLGQKITDGELELVKGKYRLKK